MGGEGKPSHTPNYRVIDQGKDHLSHIEIVDGKFRGVVYMYGSVGLEDSDGEVRLKFVTQVVSKPWRLMFTSLKTNDLFTDVTGRILVELMAKVAADPDNILVA